MDISTSSTTRRVSKLVGRAKATANRLLFPVPATCDQWLSLDQDVLLSGLQSRESLTGFHPFGDRSFPIPAGQSGESAIVPPAVRYDSGRETDSGSRVVAVTVAGQDQSFASNDDSVKAVMNHELTQLIEQVYQQTIHRSEIHKHQSDLGKTDSPRGASSRRTGPGRLGQQPIAGMSLADGKSSVDKPRQDSVAPASSAVQSGEKKMQSGDQLSFGEAGNTHPVFAELETLVNHLDASKGFPVVQDARSGNDDKRLTPLPSDRPSELKSHLADLTQVLVKHTQVVRTVSEKATVKPLHRRNHQPESSQGEGRSSHRPDKKSMPDIVKRSHGLSISEQVSDPLGLQGLSPTDTQRMADALNDYLQEQAERHGVDLS